MEVSETLLGSAPASTNYWFLVESRTPFTPKVVKQSPLAEQLKPLTARLANRIPTARVQFIRRPEMRNTQAPLQAFIADARQPEARLRGRQFGCHEELFDIEWPEEPSLSAPRGFSAVSDPLVLICTHGKRDACCAVHGRAFLKGLSQANRALVWESSHIGGHRFAATCVTLPAGHYYGRLHATDANPLLEATMQNRLFDLRTYRGFATLPVAAQVAEGELRKSLGLLGISEVLYAGLDSDNAHVFKISGSERLHKAYVTSTQSENMLIKSCGREPEPFIRHTVAWSA